MIFHDDVRVDFKNGHNLVLHRDLFLIDHAATGLIDNLQSRRDVLVDLLRHALALQRLHWIRVLEASKTRGRHTGILNRFFTYVEKLAVSLSPFLLVLCMKDLQRAPLGCSQVVLKGECASWVFFPDPAHQSNQHPHAIAQKA